MAKQQQSIRDFSGGINRGSNKKNLKDNQLVESKNFISDTIGQLVTVQDSSNLSTNSLNKVLPTGSQKNIHSWSTDYNFEISGQTSNVVVPTITEQQAPKQARLIFWISSLWKGDHLLRTIEVNNLDRDGENIFSWSVPENPNNYLDLSGNKLDEYTDLEAQGLTVKQLEDLANQKTNGGTSSSIPWIWKKLDSNSVDAVSYNPNGTANSNRLSTTTAYSNAVGGTNRFVVLREDVNTDFGPDIAQYPVWRMEAEFEYYGKINFDTISNIGWLSPHLNNNGFTFDSVTTAWDDINLEAENQGSNFNRANLGWLVTNKGSSYPGDEFGAYSKWLYGIENIPYDKQADYSVAIEYYTNFAQTTTSTVTLSYTNLQGEFVDDVVNGLFGGGDDKVDGVNSDQQIYWKRVDNGVEIYQDQRTLKPYGIKTITVARANEVDFANIISSGDRYSRLVAIGNSNSQASIYSLDTDQWQNWTIDLRIDKTDTTNDADISFFDSEGYLSIGDMSFRSNNKPKWYGFLSFNKTYLDADILSDNFTQTDLAPTPFEYLINSGNLVKDSGSPPNVNYTPQWSHMGLDSFDANTLWSGKPGYTAGDEKLFFRSGGASDENKSKIAVRAWNHRRFSVEVAGLKVYPQFLDDTAEGSGVASNTAGTFTKDESVELYFSYVYKGGYVSKPKRFQVDASSTSTNYQSTSPKEDNRALGLMVVVGEQLIGGDGTNSYNERLTGIEIWAKYTKTDPSNIYLACEIDLNKGWKSNLTGDWQNLSTLTLNNVSAFTTGLIPTSGTTHYKRNNYMIFTSPNTIESFYNRYGLDYRDNIGFDAGGTGWKTACIFNRKAYYGNFRIVGKDGALTYKPDGILKSATGMYGTVGISNFLEATVNDGDEIVSLQVVGNKLCQYKRNSLTIMGVKVLENGQTREVIEQVVHHVGIKSENQVTQTPYGLFWVSRSGVYIFTGESIQRLTEAPDGSTISKQEWENFYGERLHCGYDAYWNQVLIARDTQNNNETLIYSFNNKAFSSASGLFDVSKKTGFVQTKDGRLLWAEEFNNAQSSGIGTASTNQPSYASGGISATNNRAFRNETN